MTYVNSSVYFNGVFNNLNFPFLKSDSSYSYNDAVCKNTAELSDEDMMQQVVCESKKNEGGIINIVKGLLNTYLAAQSEEIEEKPVNTKDGVIGYTKQGDSDDCWLLSSINSLSYTEKGRKIIKSSLEYQDGSTIVHLKGAADYIITDEELEEAKLSNKYSKGDDDMILFELATEKAFEDIENDNIKISAYASINQDYDSIDGGTQMLGFGIISDRGSEVYKSNSTVNKWLSDNSNSKNLQEFYPTIKASVAFDKFEAGGGRNLALGADTGINSKEVTDINGNSVMLFGNHTYSIKEINGDKVVVTNPHDSGKDIIFSRETAANIFVSYTLCDLSND